MSEPRPRPRPTPAVPQTPAGDSGPVGGAWTGHSPLSGLQVSSYGGTLRYELHSETQRGDVFIPAESRPDVVLQVADGRGGQAGRRARPSQDSGQPSHAHVYLPRATK